MKIPGSMEIERLHDEHAQPLVAFLVNLTRDEADTRAENEIESPANVKDWNTNPPARKAP